MSLSLSPSIPEGCCSVCCSSSLFAIRLDSLRSLKGGILRASRPVRFASRPNLVGREMVSPTSERFPVPSTILLPLTAAGGVNEPRLLVGREVVPARTMPRVFNPDGCRLLWTQFSNNLHRNKRTLNKRGLGGRRL